MMTVAPKRLRWLCAAVATCGLLVSGCSDEGHSSSPEEENCNASETGCYDLANVRGLYCYVQQTRVLLSNGVIRFQDLPAWADSTNRDGVPIVFDFRHPTKTSKPTGDFQGELRESLQEAGVDFSPGSDAIAACSKAVDQEMMIATEGGKPVGDPNS